MIRGSRRLVANDARPRSGFIPQVGHVGQLKMLADSGASGDLGYRSEAFQA